VACVAIVAGATKARNHYSPRKENMATYNLTCADCGAGVQVHRRDAKVCGRCRLLRNLRFCISRFKRARKCRTPGCLNRYRPMHVRDLSYCGPCTAETLGHKHPKGTCLVCRNEDVPVYDDLVSVCLSCLKDPEDQGTVFEALQRGQAKRKKANVAALNRLKMGEPSLTRVD
jgi:ribosomal protein S27AE